jgi:hypothetical protein
MNKYQLISLGEPNGFKVQILKMFKERISELGIPLNLIEYIDSSNFETVYKSNLPTVVLYFGDLVAPTKPNEELNSTLADSALIIPIVSNLEEFSNQVPPGLRGINGFELSSSNRIEQLISCVLEGFNLLRHSRRIFISCKIRLKAAGRFG